MAFMSTINIIGSGFTAQQLRLDVISENITNINTTRVADGEGPYRRKVTVFQAEEGRTTFRDALAAAMGKTPVSNLGNSRTGGVRVVEIGDRSVKPQLVEQLAASERMSRKRDVHLDGRLSQRLAVEVFAAASACDEGPVILGAVDELEVDDRIGNLVDDQLVRCVVFIESLDEREIG